MQASQFPKLQTRSGSKFPHLCGHIKNQKQFDKVLIFFKVVILYYVQD